MKKLAFAGFIVALLMLCGVMLDAKTLTERESELQSIRDKIAVEKANIANTLKEQASAEKKATSFQNRLEKSRRKLGQLEKSARKVSSNIRKTVAELTSTKERVGYYNRLIHHEFVNLMYLHFEQQLQVDNNIKQQMITYLIRNSLHELGTLQTKSYTLSEKKKSQERKHRQTRQEQKRTKKEKTKYDSKLKSEQQKIKELEKKRLAFQGNIAAMEKAAKELDSLISKLKMSKEKEFYSYKFPTGKIAWPARGKILREFGLISSTEYSDISFQSKGIDIQLEKGTNINAVEDGVVVFAEWFRNSGKMIIIDHRNGFYSLYANNDQLLVSKGDEVIRSQTIARSGDTGAPDQPQLHFELRKRDNPVNPRNFLE
ncbi:MAG: peptidoglycan DD-metalloendopeptidase family protein [Candidatus Cloacimonetes bacterium]|nr:peptidoglycan DD-metalloendopeptidase family protein [Candidatus Cloacimonadota bacterium]